MASTVTSTARDFELATSEYFNLADNTDLSMGDINCSGTAWVKLESKTSIMTIFSKYSLSPEVREYTFGYTNATDRFQIVGSSGGTSATLFNSEADSFGEVSTGVWYFVMWRYDATADTIEISVNDGTKDSDSHAGGLYDGNQDFRMGALNSAGATRFWDGLIGPVSIWKKKLSDAEVTSLYNSGSGKFHKDYDATELTSLVAHWDMVETSGIAYDAHGSNNLTDNNTVTSAAGLITYDAEDASDFESSTSEYLSLANENIGSLNPGDTDFTARCWVKAESLSSVTSIMGIWIAASGNWLIYTNGTTLNITVQNGSGANGSGSYSGVATATWYCVHATHDAANNEVKLFINGTQSGAAGTVTGGPRDAGAEPFYFGRDGIGRYFDGIISGGAFWTRELSDAEILTDYNRGFGLDYQGLQDNSLTTGLYTYWSLSESSGTRVNQTATASKDLSDNNTVTGATGVVLAAAAVATGGNTSGSMAMMGIGT